MTSRFPGKPLADVEGMTLLERVLILCVPVKTTTYYTPEDIPKALGELGVDI